MPNRNYQPEHETLARYAEVAADLEATAYLSRPTISDPDEAHRLVAPFLANADREHAVVLGLDTKHRVLTLRLATIGSVDHTFMTPRELYRDALLDGATAVVLAHNHPSGDPTPSRDDERVTKRLSEAGRILGVEMLDHIVVGMDGFRSLARDGIV
jgi:DNA repair protein RadC